jgi:hypothetical protein
MSKKTAFIADQGLLRKMESEMVCNSMLVILENSRIPVIVPVIFFADQQNE